MIFIIMCRAVVVLYDHADGRQSLSGFVKFGIGVLKAILSMGVARISVEKTLIDEHVYLFDEWKYANCFQNCLNF